MRRLIAAALALSFVLAPCLALAQDQGDGGGDDQESADQSMANSKAFEGPTLRALPTLPNAGPCPYVRILYDAARTIEFKNDQQAASQVAYSGEIGGVTSTCAYKGKEPIQVSLNALFELGKGPQATSEAKTYRYWVAVTDIDKAVIAKQYFDLPVNFAGKDRAQVNQQIDKIVIPRAAGDVSGNNFEVLIGFDVTPEIAAFNRDGKRFQMEAGQAQPAAPAPAK